MDDVAPTLEEFLKAPRDTVAQVAPATLIYSNGGSRRAAALAGKSKSEYPQWSLSQMQRVIRLVFDYDVQHLFIPMLMPNQLSETTPGYRENLERWVDRGLAGPETLAQWQSHGWRVRLLGTESLPFLQPTAQRLSAQTAQQSRHTVWFYVVSESDLPWEWVLNAAHTSQARTRAEAVRALYGEDIPLATLFLSFGKPLINHDLLPPLIIGDLQCYWDQKPGYSLTDQDFRRILYDYAYLRQTWTADKADRELSALEHRHAWEQAPILGLGQRLGPFWYPQSAQPER